jgi:predicted Fe-Mo cluster-binding NifX family protein
MNNDKKKYQAIGALMIIVLFCPVLFFAIKPRTSDSIIAIPAGSPAYTSPVASVFSRCTHFVVYNGRTNTCVYVPNTFHCDAYGIVYCLLKRKTGVAIVKQISPPDFEALNSYGVKVFVCPKSATVMDAINDYKNGLLVRTGTPTGIARCFFKM